jgi:hypothetical protein
MRVFCCRNLATVASCGLLIGVPISQAATSSVAQPSTNTYPQIVRLSYVEGDVRISRGKQAEKVDEDKASGEATGWEKAAAGIPLEAGFSLVTGTGRAEIEFEDASTAYLDNNSVLTFDALSTTGGVPYTEMALLSGTATLDVQTMMPGEWFHLKTPTDNISMRYPQKAYLRVDSYLDAVDITPQQALTFQLPGSWGTRSQAVGETFAFRNGRRVLAPAPDAATSSEWDKWVAARVASRDAAISSAMKDAGLNAPVPGLADMNGQGSFFPCTPYGTCWEPTKGWVGAADLGGAAVGQLEAQGGAQAGGGAGSEDGDLGPKTDSLPAAADAQTASASVAGNGTSQSASRVAYRTEYDDLFPCSPEVVQYLIATDPVTHKQRVVSADVVMTGAPYLWTVCHTGSWIHWEHRYVWVAGTKRHHRRPIRWVKSGRSVGFVPLHPSDVAGKPPINLKNGVFAITGKKGDSVELTEFGTSKPVKLLAEAPKEFRQPYFEPLQSAEEPRAEAHSAFQSHIAVKDLGAGKASSEARGFAMGEQGVPITFDRKSQSFMVARQVMEGGRPSTVVQPLGGRGASYQSGGGNTSSMARGSSSSAGANAGSYSRSSAPAPSGGASASFHAGGGGAPSGGSAGGGSVHK